MSIKIAYEIVMHPDPAKAKILTNIAIWGLEQDTTRLRLYDERIVMADISKVQKLTGFSALLIYFCWSLVNLSCILHEFNFVEHGGWMCVACNGTLDLHPPLKYPEEVRSPWSVCLEWVQMIHNFVKYCNLVSAGSFKIRWFKMPPHTHTQIYIYIIIYTVFLIYTSQLARSATFKDGSHNQTSHYSYECFWIIGAMRLPFAIQRTWSRVWVRWMIATSNFNPNLL